MTTYQVPYVCPECDHSRWVVVDLSNEDSKRVKCPGCGFEDTITL